MPCSYCTKARARMKALIDRRLGIAKQVQAARAAKAARGQEASDPGGQQAGGERASHMESAMEEDQGEQVRG